MHWQHYLSANLQRAFHQQIKSSANSTFSRILHWNNSIMSLTACDCMEYVVYRCTWLFMYRTAETLQCSRLGERAFRAEIGNGQRRFERTALRHHFDEQLRYGIVAQRPAVIALQSFQYLCLALGAQHRTIFLEMADLLREISALIDEFQQIVIEAIDMFTKFFQLLTHSISDKGRSLTISTPGIAEIWAISLAGIALSVSTSV